MAAQEDPMVISYRQLRRAVGMIGIALPILLLVGELVIGDRMIRDSISAYYWSPTMHGVFIGSLCAIGVFLWSYYGDAKWDNWAGNIACVAAVCVALFPTSPTVEHKVVTRFVHYPSAAVLFLLLAYFCLYSFPLQDPGTTKTPKKPLRNKIYRGCGIVILLSIITIAALHLFFGDRPPDPAVFWLESIAIWAFGWSWYIKGKGLSVVQG